MLQMVRTGDLNYKQALSNCMSISAGVPVQSSDVLRQSKTSIIVFTSLVCRAAIEGGLSPEEAYSPWGTATFRRQKRQNRWMSCTRLQ